MFGYIMSHRTGKIAIVAVMADYIYLKDKTAGGLDVLE